MHKRRLLVREPYIIVYEKDDKQDKDKWNFSILSFSASPNYLTILLWSLTLKLLK